MCYVYILRCKDDTLYTGWTNNLENRLNAHMTGQGAKYTRARLPVKLVFVEKYPDRSSAQQREYEIKQLTRAKKLELIKKKL
ncbi:MAG: GIY-YIG nuclease family protein [Clostridiales bacterium]|nr:GIY-YIG nuclease family protein [Clostridiales bacterium]